MIDPLVQNVDVLRCEDDRTALLRNHDIVLVDMRGADNRPPHDPAANLVYSVRASDVRTVICDGRVLMRDRKLPTPDTEETIARVRKSMARLSRRVPDSGIQLYNP